MADPETINSILDAIFSPTFKPVKCLQRQFSAFDYTGVPIGGHNSDKKRKTTKKRRNTRLCNKTVKENHASVEIRLSDLNRKTELKKLTQFNTSGYCVVRLDDYYESLPLLLDENDNVIRITNQSAKQPETGDLDDCANIEEDGSFLEDEIFQPEIAKVESLNEISFELFDSKTLQRLELNLQKVDVSTTNDKGDVTPNLDNLNAQQHLDCELRIPTGDKILPQKQNALDEKDAQSIKIQDTDIVTVSDKDSQLAHSKEVFESIASGTNFEIYIDVDCDIEKAGAFDEPNGNTLSLDPDYGTEQKEQVRLTDTLEKLNNKCFSAGHHSALTDDLSPTRENDQAAQSYLYKTKSVRIVMNNETKSKKSGKSQKVQQCNIENMTDVPPKTKGDKKNRADKSKKSNSKLKESVTSDEDKRTRERHKSRNSDTCKVKQKHVNDGKNKPKKDKKDDESENSSEKTDVKSTSKAMIDERIETFKSVDKLNKPDNDVNKENIKISYEQKQTKGKAENECSWKEKGKFDDKNELIKGKHLESDQASSERNTIKPEAEYMRKSALKTVRVKFNEKCANTCSIEKSNSENSTNKVDISMDQRVERSNLVLSKSDRDPKPNSLLQMEEEYVDKKFKKSNVVNHFISDNRNKISLTEKTEKGKKERQSDKHTEENSTEIDEAKHRKDNNSEKLHNDNEANFIIKQGSNIKKKEVDTKVEKEMKDNTSRAQKHEEKGHYSAGKIKCPSNQQPKKDIKTSEQTRKQPINIENKNLDNMEDARSSKPLVSKPDREQESDRLLQNEHDREQKLQHYSASKDFITKNKSKTSSSEAEKINRKKNADKFNHTAIDKAEHRKDEFSQKLLEVSEVSSIAIESSEGRKHSENKHYLDSELICPSDLISICLQPKENTTTSKPVVKKSLSTENRIKKNMENVKNVTFHSENNIPRKYLECYVKLTDCRAQECKPVNPKKRKLSSTDLIEKTAKKRVIQWLEQHTSETDVLQNDNISKPPVTKCTMKMNFKIPKRSNTTKPQTYHTCKYCKNVSFETSERLYKHVERVHREKRKSESRNGHSSSNYKDVRREPGEGNQRNSSLDKYFSKYDRDKYVPKNEIEMFRSERRHSKSRKSDESSSHGVKHDKSHAKHSSSKGKGIKEKNVLIETEGKENRKSSKPKPEVNESSFRNVMEKRREQVSDNETSLTKPSQYVNTEKDENKHKTNKRILHDGGSTAVKNKPTSSECQTTPFPNSEEKQDLPSGDNIKQNITKDCVSKKHLKQKQNLSSNSGKHGGITSYEKTFADKEMTRDGVEEVKVSPVDGISTKSGDFKILIKCNLCEKSNTKQYKKHVCSKLSDRSDKIHKSSERVEVTQNDQSEELVEKHHVVNITLSQSDQSWKCKENANVNKTIKNNLNNLKLKNSEKNSNKDKHMEINVQTVGHVRVQTNTKQESVKSRLSFDAQPPVSRV